VLLCSGTLKTREVTKTKATVKGRKDSQKALYRITAARRIPTKKEISATHFLQTLAETEYH